MANLQVVAGLENALNKLGPNGENWAQGFPVSGKCCAWTACGDIESAIFLAEVGGFHDSRELFAWNDAPDRIWPEVKAIYEKAIDAAKTKG